VIVVRELVAGYDQVAVVRDLDLRVEPGEIVGLFGANGAGKTTTLSTIAGLIPRLGGEIEVLGGGVSARKSYRVAQRGLALVPEGRGVFHQLTAAENLRIHRSRESGVTVDEVLEIFPPLTALMHRRTGLLSGGEQQMLGIGCALISDPKMLMIDELSLGLAPLVVRRLLADVSSVVKTKGIGLLLVEQHVHTALEIVDRAYVLANGVVTFDGSATDLKNNSDLLVASYLGADGNGSSSSPGARGASRRDSV
jgi:branched-chain amino acid transport system ATP-binding protein